MKLYKIVKHIPDFKSKYPIVIDIESEQLYKGLVTIQLYQPEKSKKVFILIVKNKEEEKKIKKEIKKLNDYELIAHRGIYDYGFLGLNPKIAHDTKFLLRLAFPDWNNLKLKGMKPYSLEHATEKLIGKDIYKKFGIDKNNIRTRFKQGEDLTIEQLNYGALDVINTYKVSNHPKIKKWREHYLYWLNVEVLRINVQIAKNKLYANKNEIEKQLEIINNKIKDTYILLDGVNPNSPKQCIEALGVKTDKTVVETVMRTVNKVRKKVEVEYPIYKSPEGVEYVRTDKQVLLELISKGNKLAKAIFDQRRFIKAKSYLDSYNAKPYGKNYTECISFIDPMGAYTGRMSASGGDLENGINCQQIPRDYQYLFTTPFKNKKGKEYSIIHADYSTAEIRVGASIMNEPVMANLLKKGVDIHKYTASIINNCKLEDVTKEDRQSAKAINFGLLFGMGAETFVDYAYTNFGVVYTLEEAENIRDTYLKNYKNIAKYHKKIWNSYKDEYIFSPFGLRSKAKMGTDGINFAVQSAIGDTTKIALVDLITTYPNAIKYVVNIIHDAIELRVPRGKENKWAKRLANSMGKGWEELNKMPLMKIKGIPMPIEVEIYEFDKEVKIKEFVYG